MNKDTVSCSCGCGCSAEWPEPDPRQMLLLIGSGVAVLAYGGSVVARRRPWWMPLWLAALVTWFTLCKYLICTRCENYGKACDFYYLGTFAAMLFDRQPGRTLDAAGIAAEGGSMAVLQFLPVVAAIGDRKRLVRFLLLLIGAQAALLSICCRKCIKYSTDPWKRETCPSYRQAEWLFGEKRG